MSRLPFALTSRGYKPDPNYPGPEVRLVVPQKEETRQRFFPIVLPVDSDRHSVDPVEHMTNAAFIAGLTFAAQFLDAAEQYEMNRRLQEQYGIKI